MYDLKNQWKAILAFGLSRWVASQSGPTPSPEATDPNYLSGLILLENPPSADLGDLACPLFPFAKALRKGPPQIAAGLASWLRPDSIEFKALREQAAQLGSVGVVEAFNSFADGSMGSVEAAGPYLNIRYNKARFTAAILARVEAEGATFGNSRMLAGQRILVEFSSPNTNKPLHLGHLRNNALGEASARLLRAAGAEVKKVNLFNDRGIHICKSMLAWQRWGNGSNPEVEGKKSDHYVAELYVRYTNELKRQIVELKASDPSLVALDDDAVWLKTEIGAAAQAMLLAWEANDPDIRELWQRMNGWAISGIMETYRKTNVTFDLVQFEHDTYLLGKDEVLKGLSSGAFFKRPDGAVVVKLPWKDGTKTPIEGEDSPNAQKVVLRADGTSIYLTQDLGTAIHRHEIWPFDQAVYVVANEQDYHFKVLFHCLKVLGHDWAEKLFHLSYGLVNLPTGRMKTREGTVVDADDLLDELARGAAAEIAAKGREEDVGDVQAVSYQVALGALNYFLLQISPGKDMIFNPEESLSFAGNTGPYLQYMGARISSLMRKWGKPLPPAASIDPALLEEEQVWDLIRIVDAWPGLVEQAAVEKDPSRIATTLYEAAKSFSRFYHDLQVLNASDPAIVQARLLVAAAILQVLRHGLGLLNIPFLEAM